MCYFTSRYLDIIVSELILALVKKVVKSSDLLLACTALDSQEGELVEPFAKPDALICILELMVFSFQIYLFLFWWVARIFYLIGCWRIADHKIKQLQAQGRSRYH